MKRLVFLLLFAQTAFCGYYPWGWNGWLQSVATITAAPTSGVQPGSVVSARDTEALYIWTGTMWTEISGGGGGGVTSLNTLTGDLVLVAGTGISVTPSGSNITIATTGSTPVPGGANTDVQYNSSGSFAGDSGFIYSGSGNAMLTGKISSASANISGLTASEPVVSDAGKNLISGSVSSPLTYASNAFGCQTASGSQAGCLSSADWTTFNGKQASGSYITALTGDGSASGPGSAAITLATVNTNTGSFGSGSAIPSFTVNGKGLITAASSTAVFVLPSPSPSGDVLTANGTAWVAAPGGGTPGGANTQVQYNSSGSFAANSGFTYDGSGNTIITGEASSASANISGLTASSPVITDSSKNLASGSFSGTTTEVVTLSGLVAATNDIATWDSSGNLHDTGHILYPIPSPSPSSILMDSGGAYFPIPFPSPSPSGQYVVTTGTGFASTTAAPSNVTNSNGSNYFIQAAVLTCNNPSAIVSQTGSWVSSIGTISTGVCAVTISGFNATPWCVTSWNGTGASVQFSANPTSSTAISLYCNGNGTFCTGGGNTAIFCLGTH